MKTPEEIKKGLECCTAEFNECDSCPYREYNWCEEKLKDDALELFIKLFDCKAKYEYLAKEYLRLSKRLAQVERERDAAVADLRRADSVDCEHCAHYMPFGESRCDNDDCDCETCTQECACRTCRDNSGWTWRGVCEENSHA